MPRTAERTNPASSRCLQRQRGVRGDVSDGGGGHRRDGRGDREGGLRDADREGSRCTTHLVVSSLFVFLCRPRGVVVPRGARVREGAHALRRERVCVPDLCRAPQDGWTPLHYAACEGHAACVEKLLTAGAVPDATDKVTGKGVEERG